MYLPPPVESTSPFYVGPNEKGDGLHYDPKKTPTMRFCKEAGLPSYASALASVPIYGGDKAPVNRITNSEVKYALPEKKITDRMKERDQEQMQYRALLSSKN